MQSHAGKAWRTPEKETVEGSERAHDKLKIQTGETGNEGDNSDTIPASARMDGVECEIGERDGGRPSVSPRHQRRKGQAEWAGRVRKTQEV